MAYDASMELKNINPDDDNILASNLINVNFFFGKCENWVKKETSNVIYFFKCQDCQKINIKWIKASSIDMDIFYKKHKKIIFWIFFGCTCSHLDN